MVGVQGVKGVDSHVLVICLLQRWRKKESMTGIIKSMEESPLKRDESEWDCGKAE